MSLAVIPNILLMSLGVTTEAREGIINLGGAGGGAGAESSSNLRGNLPGP